ncbi:MAG: hypothetical protein WB676_04730 [Bryobacteraceae bacterium]
MKRLMLTAILAGSLTVAADTQGQQRVSPSNGLTPWYEKGLSQLTQNKPDLGAAIEARRERLLEASIRSRYFWFGIGSSLLNICLVGLYLFKRRELDFKLDQASGWIADLWNQDQCSRAAAHEAIARYNRHINLCNRVIESERTGGATAGALEQSEANARVQQLLTELADARSDKLRLEQELNEKASRVLDLSVRVQDLETKIDQHSRFDSSDVHTNVELVRRVNELEQELSHYKKNADRKKVNAG